MEISPRKSSKRTQEHVDEWLQGQGYFRKHIPRDPTCLFRAVSEQVYLTQYYHIRVRKECVEFMRQKKHLFEESVAIPFDSYLEQMACFTESGGPNEIQAISLLYKKDIILFNGQKQMCKSVTNNGFKNHIYLCHTPQKQYESVYNKNFVMAAGFCQSIMYQILYKNVFDMKNVDNTVHKMLHDRSSSLRHDKFFLKGNLEMREQLSAEIYKRMENGCETIGDMYNFSKGIPPFPYRVAKALDINIYRNIDFDVWHEIRREIKNAGWTRYNSNGLQIGDKCLIEMNFNKSDLDGINSNASALENNQSCSETKILQRKSNQDPPTFYGHIQEISKNEGSVIAFIEKIGEKRTVPYSSLKPLSLRKNKQNNWVPVYKKNVQVIESNQKHKKSSNANSNKTKEQINRIDSTSNNNNNSGGNLNNNQDSITTSNSYVSKTNKVITPLLTSSNTGSVMLITNNKDSNNENIKKEDFPEHQWQKQEWNNQGQVIGENTLGKLQNYTTNNNNLLFSGQGDIRENTITDNREDNSQVINGNSSLYYVASDGNSYPAVPYVPGYTGELIPANQMNQTLQNVNSLTQKGMELNSCDLPLSDPATLKFFYNLGLEYFRINNAWNYGPNGMSAPPESWCISVPPAASLNTNASQNIEEILEDEKLTEEKESTDNTVIPQPALKTINMCVNNVTDLQKDKLKKMDNEKKTSPFVHENIKDTENINKDKQRPNNTAPRFKKNQHYNNNNNNNNNSNNNNNNNNNSEQMYSHKKNISKQYQHNSSFNESQNFQNSQNGDMQVPYMNTALNQIHLPPGMPNSCHLPYMQQPPYVNVPYCENEMDTYGGPYYLPQGGFPSITCMPNSDVVDASNVHPFVPYFYPSAEAYSPAYPSVYPPYMHPQQPAYNGLPPQNIHDPWYSFPEQHYYFQYGPIPLQTAEISNEIGQNNNSNLST